LSCFRLIDLVALFLHNYCRHFTGPVTKYCFDNTECIDK